MAAVEDAELAPMRAAQSLMRALGVMGIDHAEAFFQLRMINGIGPEDPFEAEAMDRSDPQLTGIDPELLNPLLNLVRGAVGVGDRDDALLVGGQQRQFTRDLVGQRARLPAARTRREEDAARLLNRLHLIGVQVIGIPDKHQSVARIVLMRSPGNAVSISVRTTGKSMSPDRNRSRWMRIAATCAGRTPTVFS